MNVVSDYAGVVMPDMAGMALPTMNESEVRAMQQESFDEAVGPSRKAFQDKGVKTEEIAAFAKNEGLDLIVMGTRGYGAFKAAVLGSTATRIAAISDTPLLVIQAN